MSRTFVVTGPTRGLGLELVRAVARDHPDDTLLLIGRPGPSLTAVADEATSLGSTAVTAFPCEMGALANVQRTGADIVARCTADGVKVDGIVLNAALQMADATSTTSDGFETTFGVGIVAHHLLLRFLQPVLTPGAHLIFIGSGTHYGTFLATLMVPAPRWEAPEVLLAPSAAPDASSLKAGRRAYATSKLAVNYLCHEWNRRFGPAVRANVYDPGLMPGTGLARQGPAVQQWAWRAVMPALRVLPGVTSPAHSAAELADLLTDRAHQGVIDGYFEIGRPKPPSAASFDPAREAALFEALDNVVAPFLV